MEYIHPTGNLVCNNTYSNNVYLNGVLTAINNPMQLFGNGNNIYLATSNSNTTVSIYFRNQTISPFTYTDFSNFSQADSTINSSLVLYNALTCTKITCTNTSSTNISTSYLILNTITQNSGITCQSTASTNLLCIIP